MDEQSPPMLEEAPRSAVKKVLHTCEDTLSVMFGFIWGFLITAAGGGIAVHMWEEPGGQLTAIACGAVALAEGAFIFWLKGSLEAEYRPFVPVFVGRQPAWPVPLRPLITLWWLAHFAVGIAALVGLHFLAGFIEGRWWTVAIRLIGYEFGVFTISHTSQLYLLLAISSVWNNPRATAAIWNKRFVLDALAIVSCSVLLWRTLST